MDFAEKYISYALENGAADCVKFDIDQIVFDPRTYLKCLYGCPDFGKNHTCPSKPGTPSMAELERMLKHYRWGVIIHTHDKALSQKISFALEGIAYRDGHYFAFSMSDCALCKECAAVRDKPCRFVHEARPAFHSVGIDVYKTVQQFGLPLQTLADQDTEEQNWYSAVFVE